MSGVEGHSSITLKTAGHQCATGAHGRLNIKSIKTKVTYYSFEILDIVR